MKRFYIILFPLLYFTPLNAQTDSIPPTIACPQHDTVTLAPGGICTFQYFYAVTSSDNEPGDTLAQLSGLESGAEFPLGSTLNVFQATDAAGNTATCSFTLTVLQYFGVLICKDNVTTAIGPDCMWEPPVSLLLDGNYGCPDGYEIQVDKTPPYGNGPWLPAVFGPDDIDQSYAFRVLDTLNGNFCWGNSIKVEDNIAPVPNCQDITISCVVNDLSPFYLRDSLGIAAAMPMFEDGCDTMLIVTFTNSETPDTCGSGFAKTVHRTWTARDDSGNTSSCVQQIRLSLPTLSDLRFPANVTLSCSDDISPDSIGEPYIEFAGRKFTNLCFLGATFADSMGTQTCPGSRQILRTWTAIDWCDGSTRDSLQIIQVQDTTGPAFSNCPTNVTVAADSATCSANVDLPAVVLSDACSHIASVIAVWEINGTADTLSASLTSFPNSDTTSYDTLAVWNVTPNLPTGIANVKYIATDGCGQTSSCEFVLEVRDTVPPVAVCADTILMFNITPNDLVSVSLSELFPSGSDNCTPTDSLQFGIRKSGDGTGFPANSTGDPFTIIFFNCPDLGPQQVEIWARDFAGNADFCEIEVVIDDNDGICTSPPGIFVTGKIETEGIGNGVNNTNLELVVNPNDQGLVFQTQTDFGGFFSFTAYLFQGYNFVLTPTKDINHLDGVSTYDLLLISRHILGLEALNSPYKIIAADANKNNSITTFDIVELRKLILGIYQELPLNTSWRFVDKDFVFPDPTNPFLTNFPESISGVVNDTSFFEFDFIGVKVGDVNGTAFGDSLISADDRTDLSPFGGGRGRNFFLNVKNRDVTAGEEFTVQFAAAERALGWQFTLDAKDLEVLEILPGEGMSAANFAVFEDLPDGQAGAVTTSVENEAKDFSIKFRARKSGQLSEMLAISSRITRAEAYTMTNDAMTTSNPSLRFDDGSVAQPGFELYQNQPNPFRERSVIGFHLPEASDATLTVFDEIGRVLFRQSAHFARGHHSVSLEKTLLDGAGVLYYKLETPTESAVRKMVLLK
jgi:hypothetical protein